MNVALFGSPKLLCERIERLRKAGVERLIFFVNFGGLEHQQVLDSLALFAAEVMPNFTA